MRERIRHDRTISLLEAAVSYPVGGDRPLATTSLCDIQAPMDGSRLPNAGLHILVGLGDETMHGHGIMLAIEEMTAGQVQMAPGTLYTTIKKLLGAGLLEEVEAGVGEADARRRYYRTTGHGRAFVGAELRRLDHLVTRGRKTGLLADR